MKNNTISNYFSIYSADNTGLPENFIKEVPDFFPKCGRTIHKARNEIKVYDIGGISVNVKKYCVPPIINRILYSIGLRRPKAKSAYLNALKIREKGLETPKPFGYIIQRKYGLIKYSYFISEQIENMQRMGHDCKNKDLIKALAQYTAHMHENGMSPKDFTPNNILYSYADGQYNFALVDINRFIFKKKALSMFQACSILMKPLRSKIKLKFFVSCYADCRNFNKQFCIDRVIFLRKKRNIYDIAKRALKKLPGVRYLTGKPLKKSK